MKGYTMRWPVVFVLFCFFDGGGRNILRGGKWRMRGREAGGEGEGSGGKRGGKRGLGTPLSTPTSKGIEVISYKVHTGSNTSGRFIWNSWSKPFGEFHKSHMKRPGVQGSFHHMTGFNEYFSALKVGTFSTTLRFSNQELHNVWSIDFMTWRWSLIIYTHQQFLGWTYVRPTRFIHPWTTRVEDIIDKCNSWLADVT